jgi:activator of 2-hydroxyglutaryl-CoA dehydratase
MLRARLTTTSASGRGQIRRTAEEAMMANKARRTTALPVVIGVDIGTTSTKAVAFDTDGNVVPTFAALQRLAPTLPVSAADAGRL